VIEPALRPEIQKIRDNDWFSKDLSKKISREIDLSMNKEEIKRFYEERSSFGHKPS
jgi:hypothetical protein